MPTTMKSYIGIFNQRHINYVSMMSEIRNFAEVTLDERDIEFSTENCIKDGQPSGFVLIYVTETMSDDHKQAIRYWLDGFKSAATYSNIERGIRFPLKRS